MVELDFQEFADSVEHIGAFKATIRRSPGCGRVCAVGIVRRTPKPADEFRGNGELRNQQNPRTFFIPTRDEREAVKPGDLVKLLFEIVDPTDDLPSR